MKNKKYYFKILFFKYFIRKCYPFSCLFFLTTIHLFEHIPISIKLKNIYDKSDFNKHKYLKKLLIKVSTCFVHLIGFQDQ